MGRGAGARGLPHRGTAPLPREVLPLLIDGYLPFINYPLTVTLAFWAFSCISKQLRYDVTAYARPLVSTHSVPLAVQYGPRTCAKYGGGMTAALGE